MNKTKVAWKGLTDGSVKDQWGLPAGAARRSHSSDPAGLATPHTGPDGPGGDDYVQVFPDASTETIVFRLDANARGRAKAGVRRKFGVEDVFDRSVRAWPARRCSCRDGRSMLNRLPTRAHQVVIFHRVELDGELFALQPLFCGNFNRREP